MEKEYNVVTLKDGIEYIEIDKIEDNNQVYVVLANEKDPEKFCIRKLFTENGKEYITGLKNREEFDKIFKLFCEKNQ